MHVDLIRDASKEFPRDVSLATTSLRVWVCKYRTLAPIGRLKRLETLAINVVPDKDLTWLEDLGALSYLRLLDPSKVSDLSPLAKLSSLKTLSISTTPSWDSSNKTLCVKSLAPLASLTNLEHLELFGVHDADYSLEPLKQCTKLKSARFSKYPAKILAAFFKGSAISDDHAPSPSFPT